MRGAGVYAPSLAVITHCMHQVSLAALSLVSLTGLSSKFSFTPAIVFFFPIGIYEALFIFKSLDNFHYKKIVTIAR